MVTRVVRSALPEDLPQIEAFASAEPFRNGDFLVAVEGGRVFAFLAWRRLAFDECEILQIETLPEFRRRGFARALLQEFQKQEPGILFLEVRASNSAARYLYEAEGFMLIGVRRNYYSFPDEDALVLRFHPC